MTESSRKGIRLPWLGDEEQQGTEMQNTDNGAAAEQPEAAMTSEQTDAQPTTTSGSAAGSPAEGSGPFLQDLVDAMRQITEQARDEALAQLRASVAGRSAELRSATESRAAELREVADADLLRIGEWEEGEVRRISDEAAAKVTGRKAKLDAQLKANTASGEGAMSAVQARIDAFEREMATFFAQLNDLHDPVAFASAVKRMPRAPSLADTPAAPAEHTAPAPAPTPAVAPALAPAATAAEAAPAEAAPVAATPAAAEPWPGEPDVVAAAAPPVAAPAETEVEEVSTQVLVTGLTSFGAITSFKQSLERVPGVRRVSMGLGTSGEFIFTAVHGVGFDLSEAIRSFEGTAQFVAADDKLTVTVGSKD